MSKNYVFWGGTGHSKALRESLSSRDTDSKIIQIFDNNASLSSPFADVPVGYGESALDDWCVSNDPRAVIGVAAIAGWRGVDRLRIRSLLNEKGFQSESIFHSSAKVATTAQIGDHVHLMINSTICTDVVLRDGVIVNSASIVDHETIVDEGTHISAGVNIGANVSIGKCAFVGIGATVMSWLKIGNHSFIGAGAVVIRDVPERAVVWGVPARVGYYVDETGNKISVEVWESRKRNKTDE